MKQNTNNKSTVCAISEIPSGHNFKTFRFSQVVEDSANMRQLQPVIWSKGTFLSPQHLQAQERFVEDSVHFYLESLASNVWGFLNLQLDAKALAEGTLALTSATGVFPDALPFDVPASDPPPRGRALEKCFAPGQQSCMFYLAIPEHRPGGINVSIDSGRVSTRFTAHLQLTRDENGGGGREKPVQVAHKNLQIIAAGENLEGSVLLPCANILRTDTGTFLADPAFVPPLLNLHASDVMVTTLRSLIELLVTRSTQLSGSRRQKNQSLADFTASDVANFWLLYTINTRLPGLRHLLHSGNVAPQRLFDEMADLAGSLTSFSAKIEPRDLPQYEHESPGPCFRKLDEMIRAMLETVVPSNFVALALKHVRDTIYATSIDKDSYLENTRLYLAVSADMRDPDIIDRSPKLMKLCSATHIESLISHALPGLRLTHVPNPPRAIAVKLRYHYFSIEQTGQAWESILRARNFAVYAPSDFINPTMELVILLPSAAAN
jgi:type VI secretion system protein ImpJ